MKLNPLADNVLVKNAQQEETTASGIILSTANKEKSLICDVVAVGPGTEEHPMTVALATAWWWASTPARRSSSTTWTIAW